MENAFLSVLNMSLTATYVIIVVLLARLGLRKAPASISYMLWAVVGFRLLSPVSFTGLFSLIPFRPSPIPQDIALQNIPRVESGINALDNMVSNMLPLPKPFESANPLQIWEYVGSRIWLLGVSAMILYSILSMAALRKNLSKTMCGFDGAYECQNLKTPMVTGFIKPKIYIPSHLNEKERRYVLLHEKTHIKRGDHIIKILGFLILSLHWFNPFVWLAFSLMASDMEMSCDEKVLKILGDGIKDEYSMSLIRMATESPVFHGRRLAFGEGGIKKRVKNVLGFKKPSKSTVIISSAILIFLIVGLGINRASKSSLDTFTITTPRSCFSPMMDSMFGFELLFDAREDANLFSYLCDKGSFCSYADGIITPLGKEVTSSEKLYWWPFEETGASHEIQGMGITSITITALNKEGKPIALGKATVEENDGWFIFVYDDRQFDEEEIMDDPVKIVLAKLLAPGVEIFEVKECADRFVEHSTVTSKDGVYKEESEVANVYARYKDIEGETYAMNYTLRRPNAGGRWVCEEPVPFYYGGELLLIPQKPTGEPYSSAANAAGQYYMEQGYGQGQITSMQSVETDYSGADGKFLEKLKDETVTLGVDFYDDPPSHPLRLIVLTRNKGGEWEIVEMD